MAYVNPKFNIPSGFHPDNYRPAGKTVDDHLKAIDAKIATVTADPSTTFIVPTAPTGGSTVDTEAREAVTSIITALGLIKTALVEHGIVS